MTTRNLNTGKQKEIAEPNEAEYNGSEYSIDKKYGQVNVSGITIDPKAALITPFDP